MKAIIECLICVTALETLICPSGVGAASGYPESENVIRLLTLVPFFDSRPHAGWDRGLELLPMGRVARNEINQREDILPGYTLGLIEAPSDACGHSSVSTALVNLASKAFGLNGVSNIIGVTGLICSTVTANVSPLAGREAVDLIQMSMSNSPDLGDSTKYPHLWRTVSSSAVLINTTIALMEMFNWSRIATLHDQNGNYFLNTARNLVLKLTENGNQNTVLDIAIDESEDYIESAVQQIKSNGTRVIFVSGTPLESAMIVCAAAQKNVIWPGYQWIFYSTDHEDLVSNLNSLSCLSDQVLKAMESVILFKWQLVPDDLNTIVYSGKTIAELDDLYFEELESLIQEDQYKKYADRFSHKRQPWAFPLYDEIWAFALALNESLPYLETLNLSLTEYHFGNKNTTQTIESYLATLSFKGAVGQISFDAQHEAQTPVNIYQIRNGMEELIGKCNKSDGLVLYDVSSVMYVNDELDEQYLTIPVEFTICLIVTNVIMTIVITFLLVLTVFYRRSVVIKANSTLLSSLIFLGCYIIGISTHANIYTLSPNIIFGEEYFTISCNVHIWCWMLGMGLILGTNLVKLVRIYWIFTHMKDSGRLLTNYALFGYDLLLGIVPFLIALLWSLVDPLHYQQNSLLYLDENPPYVGFVTHCTCTWFMLWRVLLALYVLIMMFILAAFALKTRKIKLDDFKDTKKMTFFVFFLALVVVGSSTSAAVVSQIGQGFEVYVAVIRILTNFGICLLCMVFLIAPKVLPVFYQHIRTGKYKSAPAKDKAATLPITAT